MGIKKTLARNLRQPKGFLGKLVGILMNKGNDYMNRFTLRLVNAQRGDHVLEIGFGNGKYIKEIATEIQEGFVAGVDFSETMVKVARKRNKAFIEKGMVDIKLGEVNKIAFDTNSFDKVFTVNTIYFWPSPEAGLEEVYRVIKPGGKLVIAFRSKEKMEKLDFTRNGFRLFEPTEVVQLVQKAGFKEVSLKSSEDKQLDVNCVTGVK